MGRASREGNRGQNGEGGPGEQYLGKGEEGSLSGGADRGRDEKGTGKNAVPGIWGGVTILPK